MSFPEPASAADTTFPLSAAYTYASAGAAYYAIFANQEAATLTDFWVKVSSYSGTWGSTDGVINVQIREGNNGNSVPGTNLAGSFTVTLDGVTTGWIKTTGLSVSLSAGKFYSIVIGDADGGGTNFVTMVSRCGNTAAAANAVGQTVTTTANGYSTAGTATTGQLAAVWKVGSILYGGNGYTAIATIVSSTAERGMRFMTEEDCTLVGASMGQDGGILFSGHTINLYPDSSAPGGTKLMSLTCPTTAVGGASSPIVNLLPFPSASRVDLTANTWYRFVLKPVIAATTPRKITMSGSPDSDVINTFMPFGNAHWIQDVSGSWDDSQTSSMSNFGPVLAPRTTAAGGGGFTVVFV